MCADLVKLEVQPDLVERVYASLLDAISDGSLPPGERITQESIAERLAVSRQPVLQALRLLKKDGFVLDAPGRGVWVAPLDADWMAQVYAVRGVLDALAARLAAQRRVQLDAGLLARGRAAATGTDVRAMIDADLAFHGAIYAAAQNAPLEQMALHQWRHLRRVMGAVLRHDPQRAALWDEHEAIAHAIAAGQPAAAARLIEAHSRHASEHLAQQLNKVLPKQKSPGDHP